jgi:ABC-type nitrate/sulfonate/bicarbonate transport system substrate-binding protein
MAFRITRLTQIAAAVTAMLVTLSMPGPSRAETPPIKLTVFTVPNVTLDSIWMADAEGYFKQAGLQVELKAFPSGTTAIQSFKAGAGDIMLTGELPGVAYWHNTNKQYRIIAVVHREAVTYSIAATKAIKSAADLKGKTIATRVGSTGSWFISEYLKKNGVAESDVKIKDLDTQVLPVALCRGDIDAFFIWHPAPARAVEICPDKAHILGTAEGYINGYGMLGSRAEWLEKPENAKAVALFLGAMEKGRIFAEKNYPKVFAYVKTKFGYNEDLAKFGYDTVGRYIGFDKVFYHDFCQLSAWMQGRGLLKEPIKFDELVYTKGLMAVDPKLVALPSNTCPAP